MSDVIYLDHNATLPVLPVVRDAMLRAQAVAWGNPSSLHAVGRAARRTLDEAREAVAVLAGASARDVVLTSGGTEANNLGIARLFPEARGTLITSELEHPSVLALAEELGRRGVTVHFLHPRGGRFVAADLTALLHATDPALPRLVATHAVHPETGAIQPVQELFEVARAQGVALHVDAIQAAGRVDASLFRGGFSVALAAHKLGGPKGIGALVHPPGAIIRPLLFGGAQERGIRPGTPDPIAASGFGAAAHHALQAPASWEAVRPLRDELEAALLTLPGLPAGRLPVTTYEGPAMPHVIHLAFPGWAADELLAALDLEGVCVSAGSACSAGTSEPSRAVRTLRGREHASSSIRISLGPSTSREDVAVALDVFTRVVPRH